MAVAFLEAGIGLGLVSLMISYLPTIYGAFSRREALVGMLEVRAGLPPSPSELFRRFARIGWLDSIDEDVFEPWESWFVDIEESHSSTPALVFFRSPHPERSWITAARVAWDSMRACASRAMSGPSRSSSTAIRLSSTKSSQDNGAGSSMGWSPVRSFYPALKLGRLHAETTQTTVWGNR